MAALGRSGSRLFAKSWALDLYGFSAFVIAAHGAGMMRPAHGPALRTTGEAGELQRQMTSALALTGLWITFFRQWWHESILSFRYRTAQGGQTGPAIIGESFVAVTIAFV